MITFTIICFSAFALILIIGFILYPMYEAYTDKDWTWFFFMLMVLFALLGWAGFCVSAYRHVDQMKVGNHHDTP